VGTCKYPLEPGQAPRLVARWRGDFRDFTLALDDEVLLTAADAAALAAEPRGVLPDGRNIRVALRSNRLYVLVAGTTLYEAGQDPRSVLKTSYGLLYFVAAFTALTGAVAMTPGGRFLHRSGFGWPSIAAAVVVATLARLVQTRLSKTALAVAITIFVVDGVASIVLAALSDGVSSSAGVAFVAKLAFVQGMAQGFGAIDALRAQTASKSG